MSSKSLKSFDDSNLERKSSQNGLNNSGSEDSLHSPSATDLNLKGHSFAKKSFNTPTYCQYCKKYIIGIAKQGYLCKICGSAIHKKCLLDAEKLTECTDHLKEGDVLEKMPLKKKKEAIQLLSKEIKDAKMVTGAKLNVLLVLLFSDIENLVEPEIYESFKSKLVEDVLFDSPTSPRGGGGGGGSNKNIRKISTLQPKDLNIKDEFEGCYSILLQIIKASSKESEKFVALKILAKLLEDDGNKKTFTLFFERPKELLKYLQEKDITKHSLPLYKHILECLNALVVSDFAKEQIHVIGGLEQIVEFLKHLFAMTFERKEKQKRQELNDAQLEGAEILTKFYLAAEHYRFIIDRHDALSFIIIWCSHGKIKIHHEIDEKDVSFDNLIYDSPLCQVFEGKWKGKTVALKRFDKETMNWQDFWKEVALLTVTQHPTTVRFYGACSKGDKPFLCVDYFKRGSLEKVLSRSTNSKYPIDDSLIVNMAMNAANGLSFLHSKHIIHRDVKTQNFLVNDVFAVKVIDFGVSRIIDNEQKMTLIGTPIWMAPEVLARSKYTEKADVYSFGLVLWAMVSGKQPFDDVNPFALANAVVKEHLRPPMPTGTNITLSKLITQCWQEDPDKRPSFMNILDTLWNMKEPSTGRYFVRGYEYVSDELYLSKVFSLLDVLSLSRISQTSKRYKGLVQSQITKLKPKRKTTSSNGITTSSTTNQITSSDPPGSLSSSTASNSDRNNSSSNLKESKKKSRPTKKDTNKSLDKNGSKTKVTSSNNNNNNNNNTPN